MRVKNVFLCIIFREGVERVFNFKSAKAKLVKMKSSRGRKFDLNFLSANKSFMNMFGNNDLCNKSQFSTSKDKSDFKKSRFFFTFLNYTLLEKT